MRNVIGGRSNVSREVVNGVDQKDAWCPISRSDLVHYYYTWFWGIFKCSTKQIFDSINEQHASRSPGLSGTQDRLKATQDPPQHEDHPDEKISFYGFLMLLPESF